MSGSDGRSLVCFKLLGENLNFCMKIIAQAYSCVVYIIFSCSRVGFLELWSIFRWSQFMWGL